MQVEGGCLLLPHCGLRQTPSGTSPALLRCAVLCRKKADEYLGHFVGHEGSGSLLSALKARGWASELSAGVSEQSSVAWLFEITITLTEAGLAAGPGERWAGWFCRGCVGVGEKLWCRPAAVWGCGHARGHPLLSTAGRLILPVLLALPAWVRLAACRLRAGVRGAAV